MAVVENLIRLEVDHTISFGNYLLSEKKKVLDFEVLNDLYKIKTFKDITKLEKNGNLVFESIPGSTVHHFFMDDRTVSFGIEASEDLQITTELEIGKEYKLFVDKVNIGKFKTNLSGKLSFGVEVSDKVVDVKIEQV